MLLQNGAKRLRLTEVTSDLWATIIGRRYFSNNY